MFEFKREHGVYWFNSSCIESSTEYELIGVLIGVAIFNGVILPLRLPVTVYKKLTGARLTLMDLSEVEPALGTSLQQLLDYDGDDVEEIFGLTFTATTTYFDTTLTHELRPGGADIPVTQANKQRTRSLALAQACARARALTAASAPCVQSTSTSTWTSCSTGTSTSSSRRLRAA